MVLKLIVRGIIFLVSFNSLCTPIYFPFDQPMNFATVTDDEHYPWLTILIDTIKELNPHKKIRLLIFDIGLSQDQIATLQSDPIVEIYPIEQTHPDLTTKFVVRPNGRLARGWYAWKPVAIKQAFDLVPYFLYIDAGKRLMGPSDDIFHAMLEHGYFLFDCGHIIDPMTTKKVKVKFNLNSPENSWILDQFGVEAGIQGLTKQIYETYIMPMYELAHEIEWFADDGTAPWGFGGCRHDQTLFSIMARINRFNIIKVCGDGPDYFMVKGRKIAFNRNNYFQYKEMSANPKAEENHLL